MSDTNSVQRSDCPTDDLLSDFLLGKLRPEDYSRCCDHLDTCDGCQMRLSTVDAPNDGFVDAFSQPILNDQYVDELECGVAIRHAKLLSHPAQFESSRHVKSTAIEELNVKQLGPYCIQERLGAGGMGTVYKALHTRLQRTVALKTLHAHRLTAPDALKRFEREMALIGNLHHPNIVSASDADDDEGIHYLVMEYVKGPDVSLLQKKIGKLPTAEACELVRQAALGLQYIHENGLVHRDVKPSNLILAVASQSENDLGQKPTVKILDLGLAMFDRNEDGNELTSTGQVMGTVDYMAPEQLANTHEVDIRADIYSLGATLYRLLAGHVPFPDEVYADALQKIAARARDEPKSVSVTRPDLDPRLVTVVTRMLHRDPDKRFQTPGEVAEMLQDWCGDADLARLLVQAESSSPNRSPTGMDCIASPRPASPVVNRRISYHCAGLAGILIAIIAAYWHWPQSNENVSPVGGGAVALNRFDERNDRVLSNSIRNDRAAADASGNGRPGIVAQQTSESVEVTPSARSEDIRFLSGQHLGDRACMDVATGDLNGDGLADIYLAHAEVHDTVWMNDGSGGFRRAEHDVPIGESLSVEIGDLDGDGDLDAVVTTGKFEPNQICVNDGTGRLLPQPLSLDHVRTHAAAIHDLNAGGQPDIMLAVERADDGAGVPYLNEGGLQFIKQTELPIGKSFAIAVADFNGDGSPDILPGVWGKDSSLWLNDGSGKFVRDDSLLLRDAPCLGVAIGDLSDDGHPEAVFALANRPDLAWQNDGEGRLRSSNQRLTPGTSRDVALADFDGDGRLDIVTATGSEDVEPNALWRNEGACVFSDCPIDLGTDIAVGVAVADLNGDQKPDIVFGMELGGRIWINESN